MLCEAILVISFAIMDGTRKTKAIFIQSRADYNYIMGTLQDTEYKEAARKLGMTDFRQEKLFVSPEPFLCTNGNLE